MRRSHVLAPLLLVVVVARGQSPPGHYHLAGSLRTLLAPGASAGEATGGVAFAVTLTDGGSAVSDDAAALASPAFPQPLHVRLDSLAYGAGHLTGRARFSNDSGAILEGLRLDLDSAQEEYRDKDDKGQEVLRTRLQPARWDSPHLFGDLPRGAPADTLVFDVGGLGFVAATAKVAVTFRLSGLAYERGVDVPGAAVQQLDVDSTGRLYVGDTVGNCLWRGPPEGPFTKLAGLLDQCVGMAVDRKSGMGYATVTSNRLFQRFDADGKDLGNLTFEAAGVKGWVHHLRADAAGALWFGASGRLVRLVDGKIAWSLEKLGDEDIEVASVDFAADGSAWVVSGKGLFRVSADGKTVRQVATGDDWHPGRLYAPAACEVDATGNVFVAESGKEGEEYWRISQFDAEGRVVRVFGRAAKVPGAEGALLEGQVHRPVDLAVLPDGRLVVGCDTQEGGLPLLVFRPF
ncbi:MAG: hypothetical protein HYU66_20750 [Armatimonadetes bacterium]|nr:hypothetical protein [Armatimonadota bacterium]